MLGIGDRYNIEMESIGQITQVSAGGVVYRQAGDQFEIVLISVGPNAALAASQGHGGPR